MFWIGFGVGAIIGSAMSFFIMALCFVSGREDDYAEKMYKSTFRGDENGDN